MILALALAAAAQEREPLDLFIGTIAVEQDQVVLTRCNLGNDRYKLRDASDSQAVATFRKDHTGDAPIYAEVYGAYHEEGGQHVLNVAGMEADPKEKDCHLVPPVRPPAVKGAAAAMSPADAAFAGHYYLSGLREVGSELWLGTDGHFDWMMVYGGVDQAAMGRWQRNGQKIILTSDKPASDKPFYTLGRTVAWDSAAEKKLLTDRRDALEAKVRDTCPFFTDSYVSSPPLVPDPSVHPSPAALKARAAETLAKALAERAKVEGVAKVVMAMPHPEVERDAVQPVLSAWVTAREEAERAASEADLPAPDLAPPHLPAACNLPADVKVDAPARWIGGKAVSLSDERANGIGGARVTMLFADGHYSYATTNRQGFAYLANDTNPSAVRALILVLAGHTQRFDIAPMASGVVAVTVDTSQLIHPAFDTLTLTIDGANLRPAGAKRGEHYRRQP